MDELGEIAKAHQPIFVNGYTLCDWVKDRLECLIIDQEEIDDLITDMIEYIEYEGDEDW
jgi:hypothetical protein